MVLTVYFALSPVTGLSCHRRSQEAYFSRTWRQRRGVRTTRFCRPHQRRSSAQNVGAASLSRPPHPLPYVRDDRETPLRVGRDV